MSFTIPTETSSRQALADELLHAYAQWREQCIAVHDAYDRWSLASAEQAPLAAAAYEAALDREEHASKEYAELVGRAAELVSSDRIAAMRKRAGPTRRAALRSIVAMMRRRKAFE
jgi:hypothetical protein